MCGIAGIVSYEPVNQKLYDALLVLQHRGQESAGIATADGHENQVTLLHGIPGVTVHLTDCSDGLLASDVTDAEIIEMMGAPYLAAANVCRAFMSDMLAAGGTIAPWFASITFGGPDLKTVYVGSLRGTRIPYFQSPVAGLPMVHWK